MTDQPEKPDRNSASGYNMPNSKSRNKQQQLSGLTPEQKKLIKSRLKARFTTSHAEIRLQHDPAQPAPLSFTQKRLWFLSRLYPGSAQYNQMHAWRVKGPLSLALLEQSIQLIVDRHDVLRMHVLLQDEALFQEVAAHTKIDLAVVSLEHLPPGEREQQCRQYIVEATQKPFDLTTGPLLRAHAFCLADELHIVLLEIHHIASDGWSYNLFKNELSVCYNALLRGQRPLLPELPVQYSDFARYQQARFANGQLDSQLAYWKQQLSGEITPHGLPSDLPRPAMQSDHGANFPFAFTAELSEKLHSFCKQEGVTTFMVLAAALNTLIYRYAGNEDIFIGTAIANRTLTELENLIGFFANTLVLRTDLGGNPDFRELTRRVYAVAVEAYTHQDMPFEELVAELKPERSLSHTPLFQISIVYQNTPASSLVLDSLQVSDYETGNKSSKFDLTLQLTADQGNIRGYWNYCTDLFYESTIERLSGHFLQLLEQGLTQPDKPVSSLPMLSTAELNCFRNEWNYTDKDYGDFRCAHHLFEQQAAATPDAIAVTEGNQHLAYRELNVRANQLAHYLRNSGAGPDTLIGLCTKRSIDQVIAVLGILKSGAGYVPMDPAYPRERLQYILQEITLASNSPPILLTRQDCLEQLTFFQGQIISLDEDRSPVNTCPVDNPAHINTLKHTAYVIFTSGSTGTPKGVIVPHGSLYHYLSWVADYFLKGSPCVAPLFTSISFDLTITCLYTPLLSGGKLIVYTEKDRDDNLAVLDVINDNQVDFIKLTPSHLALISTMELNKSRIKTVIVGGEDLKTDMAKRVINSFGSKVSLFNAYGPTETTVECMIHRFDLAKDTRESVPIGRPIANAKIYILDRHQQPVPVGVTGEIHIGGNGMARGYLNQPGMTAEKFIPNPFSDKTGSRLYKSGDLARYMPDGIIEFIGRIDHQIKLRGYRIEPAEIEAVLLTHPQVAQALVLASQKHSDDMRLLAYLILENDTEPLVAEWRTLLASNLPDNMIPDDFIVLESFPLTINGKIDVQSLPIPDRDRTELAQTYIAPRTPIEETLAIIWQTVLNTDRVGIKDNFFELGGHSLLAARIMALTNDEFVTDVPLRSLFETPTIEAVAVTVIENLIAHTELDEMESLTEPHEAPAENSGN